MLAQWMEEILKSFLRSELNLEFRLNFNFCPLYTCGQIPNLCEGWRGFQTSKSFASGCLSPFSAAITELDNL